MQVLQGGQKMVRKEVELLRAVGVGVCAEYGSLVHKHVEEAANSHFLHEISWDMAHYFFSIEALQHTTIFKKFSKTHFAFLHITAMQSFKCIVHQFL